jgi:glycosyltransferase involved in cell wall biosynthesis
MKILYLSGFVLPSRAAHGVHVMRMCQAMARNGHDVTLFACRQGRVRAEDVYGYYGVEPSFAVRRLRTLPIRGGTLLSLPRLHRELKTHDRSGTLVYARSTYGAFLASKMGFPVVYEAHCPPPHPVIRSMERRIFVAPNFQKLVVISESLRRIYDSIYGPVEPVEVCHDAADPPASGGGDSHPWPGRSGRLQLGYAGHLSQGRGIDVILEAARRLPQHDFHVIGGREQDIEYWRQQVGDNVHLHGFVPPAHVSRLLSQCDVLLMPAQKGLRVVGRKIDISAWMSPMKLFEYMASRRAIIASDLPVLREVLNEGNAILVTPGDPDAWVSAIRSCEDRTLRDRLAESAYRTFLANHTWQGRAARALSGLKNFT